MKLKKTQGFQTMGKRTLFTSMAAVALLGSTTTAVLATTNVNHVKAVQVQPASVTTNRVAVANEPDTPNKHLGDYTIDVKSTDFTNVEIGWYPGNGAYYISPDGKYEGGVSAFIQDNGAIKFDAFLSGIDKDNGGEEIMAFADGSFWNAGETQRAQVSSSFSSGEHIGETKHIFGYVNITVTIDGQRTGAITDALDNVDYLEQGKHHLSDVSSSSSESSNQESSDSNSESSSESSSQESSNSNSSSNSSSSSDTTSHTTGSSSMSSSDQSTSTHKTPGTTTSNGAGSTSHSANGTVNVTNHQGTTTNSADKTKPVTAENGNKPTTLLQTGQDNHGMTIATIFAGIVASLSGLFVFGKRF
ncbi:hypothetical protein [Latilactobacillus sakei]|uniref:hypothetical protein n=1 Tax=Latilactobacillus sakei TaxID=1599 RepID=UPI002072BDC7|nr:hypothetical protein [Latilactobacillus sakei]